ncbi:YdeI/OmpD-associated family protein [Nocardiopsis prasina]|uniref:YdeI/OmpD-associated family protein n=1 Tax=Nocardiopsis prasina TaxID=2015 RepID=UPI00035E2BAA|nr:YdeI/OmpD-associated family protein [Nocardiopsis prasina]
MDEEPLLVSDAAAWRAWLDTNEDVSDGVWLVLAKKGTSSPTSLTYAQALEEALCGGWIDGRKERRDASTFLQRFTPRRNRSTWSLRNVGIARELTAQGRMRPRGQAEIDRARSDGRWERAYPGSATIEAPADLTEALRASPTAESRFASLTAAERYPLLLQIVTAAPELRERRIATLVQRLRSHVPEE